jgi:hypothetical protein
MQMFDPATVLADQAQRIATNWEGVVWHDVHPGNAVWDGPGPLSEDARAASRARRVALYEDSITHHIDAHIVFGRTPPTRSDFPMAPR